MRFDHRFTQAAVLALATAATFAAQPGMAADDEKGNLPSCNRRNSGLWMCVYDVDGAPDGSPYKSFEGSISNGIPNGSGVLVFDNDDRYEGTVRNGVPEGRGLFVFADNSRYEGTVKKGKPDGYGTYNFNDGSRYQGSLLAGQPHGYGTFKFATGEVFQGLFYLGQAKGQGTYKTTEIVCSGRFFSSELSGRGNCRFEDGTRYTGEFRKGLPEGRG
ncbi:MAG: hypothetical protein HC805_05040 [Alkalinema sp. RL_2_19]|nr:hypothetical protein [Alkalinema sp. RL_2_19]